MTWIRRAIQLLLSSILVCAAVPCPGNQTGYAWQAGGFASYERHLGGFEFACYATIGRRWSLFRTGCLLLSQYNRMQWNNSSVWHEHSVGLAFLLRPGRHRLYLGGSIGIRNFSMGPHWTHFLGGLNAGYRLQLTPRFSLGLDYKLMWVEGGGAPEGRLELLPLVHF